MRWWWWWCESCQQVDRKTSCLFAHIFFFAARNLVQHPGNRRRENFSLPHFPSFTDRVGGLCLCILILICFLLLVRGKWTDNGGKFFPREVFFFSHSQLVSTLHTGSREGRGEGGKTFPGGPENVSRQWVTRGGIGILARILK